MRWLHTHHWERRATTTTKMGFHLLVAPEQVGPVSFSKGQTAVGRQILSLGCVLQIHHPRAVREDPGREKGWTWEAKAQHLWVWRTGAPTPPGHRRTVSFFFFFLTFQGFKTFFKTVKINWKIDNGCGQGPKNLYLLTAEVEWVQCRSEEKECVARFTNC